MPEPYMSVFRPGLFKGHAAIVTGGGTGIGKGIASELLLLGCNVVIASRNEETLKKGVAELEPDAKAGGGRLIYVQASIKVEEHVKNLVKTALDTFGRLDYVVNNGGGQFVQPSADMSVKGWSAVVETNLTGPWLVSK